MPEVKIIRPSKENIDFNALCGLDNLGDVLLERTNLVCKTVFLTLQKMVHQQD